MLVRNWLQQGLIGGIAVLVSACAGQATQPEALSQPAFSEKSAEVSPASTTTVAPLKIAGIDVNALAKGLRKHPFAHYRVANNSYSYYAGGVLYAEYQADSNVLLLRPDPEDGNECVLDLAGGDGNKGEDGIADVCKRLLNTLRDELGEQAMAGN